MNNKTSFSIEDGPKEVENCYSLYSALKNRKEVLVSYVFKKRHTLFVYKIGLIQIVLKVLKFLVTVCYE